MVMTERQVKSSEKETSLSIAVPLSCQRLPNPILGCFFLWPAIYIILSRCLMIKSSSGHKFLEQCPKGKHTLPFFWTLRSPSQIRVQETYFFTSKSQTSPYQTVKKVTTFGLLWQNLFYLYTDLTLQWRILVVLVRRR